MSSACVCFRFYTPLKVCVCVCVCVCVLAWQGASSLYEWLQSADCVLWYGMYAGLGERRALPKRTEQPPTNLVGLVRAHTGGGGGGGGGGRGSHTPPYLSTVFLLLLPHTLSLENISLFEFFVRPLFSRLR